MKGILKKFKNLIREKRKSGNFLVRRLISFLYFLRHIQLFVTDSSYRSVIFLDWKKPVNLHQTTPLTKHNRYPKVFKAVSEILAGTKEPTILSFGCSTGEEVFSLREYFPDALISLELTLIREISGFATSAIQIPKIYFYIPIIRNF